MNATHFQTYSNLSSSPHSPSPDDIRYTTLPGHIVGGSGSANAGGNGNGGGNNVNSIGLNNGNCNGNNNLVHHHHHHQQQHQQQNGHHEQHLQIDGPTNDMHQHQHHHHHNNHHHSNHPHQQQQPNFHQLNNNNSLIKYCSGCGGKIVERFYLHALDRYWHNSCLKCYSCGALLADIGSSCYTREGMILCKSDYIRMFGKAACSNCGQIIAANEFVMRTTTPYHHHQQQHQNADHNQKNNFQPPTQIEHHVFHIKCFACSKCASQLRPGDKYYMLAGSLVCEQDWHKLLLKSTTSTSATNPPIRKGKVGRPRRSRD